MIMTMVKLLMFMFIEIIFLFIPHIVLIPNFLNKCFFVSSFLGMLLIVSISFHLKVKFLVYIVLMTMILMFFYFYLSVVLSVRGIVSVFMRLYKFSSNS